MAVSEKTNKKCWQGCRDKGNQPTYRLVQPVCETVRRFTKNYDLPPRLLI